MRFLALFIAATIVASMIVYPNAEQPRHAEAPELFDDCEATYWLPLIPASNRVYGEPTLAPAPAPLRPAHTAVFCATIAAESGNADTAD